MTQDKITIQEAARVAKIGRKTIYRWIDKGLLSREKDGNRAYVSLAEVRALCVKGTVQQDTEDVSGDTYDTQEDTLKDTRNDTQTPPRDIHTVTVNISYLEGLLVRLGQMEAEKRYLLEYKTGLEAKDKALEQAKENISVQAQELAAVRSALDTNSAELDQARATIMKARNELQRLLKIKQDAEQKAKVVLDQQNELEAKERDLAKIRAENERLKQLRWWERLFRWRG